MDGFNEVTLIGSVGKDAETKLFGENSQKTTFSVATNRSFKNKQGEKETHTDWHNIEVWGDLAKFTGNFVKKGNLVAIKGEIRYDKFDDKEGKPQQRTKIVASKVQILPNGKKNENAATTAGAANVETAAKQTEEFASNNAQNNTVTSAAFSAGVDDNEDLPF